MDLATFIQAAFVLHPVSFLTSEKAPIFLSNLSKPVLCVIAVTSLNTCFVHFSAVDKGFGLFTCIEFRQACILPSISKESIAGNR